RAQYKGFPRGTVRRRADSKLDLPGGAPVDSRVSFYVDLLPYLGRDNTSIDRTSAWNSPGNLPAAERWVPELLVPYYPSWSWLAGGGATIVGLDDDPNRNPMDDFSYQHPGRDKPGSHALMGDGSVRYVPADINRKVLYGMATRDGGGNEPLPGEDAPLVPAPEK